METKLLLALILFGVFGVIGLSYVENKSATDEYTKRTNAGEVCKIIRVRGAKGVTHPKVVCENGSHK